MSYRYDDRYHDLFFLSVFFVPQNGVCENILLYLGLVFRQARRNSHLFDNFG